MITNLINRLSLEDEEGAVGGEELGTVNQRRGQRRRLLPTMQSLENIHNLNEMDLNNGTEPGNRQNNRGRAEFRVNQRGRRGRDVRDGVVSQNGQRIREDHNVFEGDEFRAPHGGRRGRGRGRGGHGDHRRTTKSLNRNNERLPNEEINDDTRQEGAYMPRGRQGQHKQHLRNQEGTQKERKSDLLNFGRMRMYERKDPSAILLSLGHEKSGLSELLNSPRQNSDMVKLAASVIAKGCTSDSAPQNKINILMKLSESRFLKIGIPDILMDTLASSEEDETESQNTLKDICEIMIALFCNIPATCFNMDLVGVTTIIEKVIDELRSRTSVIDEEIIEKFTEIKRLQEKRLNKQKTKRMTDEQKDSYFEEVLPPEDFRQMSILPNMEDLDPDSTPFLRKNKVTGSYSSTDDYLDVQFRLLREDFIQPLRNGIDEYQRLVRGDFGKGKHRITEIRVYTGVNIVRSVCSRTDLLYRLQFDISKLKKVNWKISKRLIFGSLVCLSADNFRTFYIATVCDRDTELLKEGKIDVKFEHELQEIDEIPEDQQFVMVETTAFFEAYRHVLKGLQDIRNLPFESYIVLSQSNVKPPTYLRENSKFDLRPLVDAGMKLRGNDDNLLRQGRREVYQFSSKSKPAEAVELLDEFSWPNHNLLNLDKSQFSALKTALTKEFSVIQGPPGTGKTYVGLKIVKALLHNSHVWNRSDIDDKPRPMLIVCYTNHALDQFMEGITEFYTGKIIRIGGRISSQEMEKYSLRHWRKMWKDDRRFREFGRLHYMNMIGLKDLHRKIEMAGQRLEAAKSDILTEDELLPVMSPAHREQLSVSYHRQLLYELGYQVPDMSSVMTEWLGIAVNGMITDELVQENELDQEENDAEDDSLIDVEDEGNITTNNRLLDSDEQENDLDFQQVIEQSRQFRTERVAFDVTNFDGKKVVPSYGFQLTREARRKLKRQLVKKLASNSKMSRLEADDVTDLWQINIPNRWRLYRYWISRHCIILKREVTGLNEQYKNACKANLEVTRQKDKLIMSSATIIAMTTTGAAKYQEILQEVNPRITIVEEAAEVLEGHTITSLTRGCEQLILIGDHKQLRPNPNVYQLATKFNLQVSLFERMLQNGVHCDCLEIQHRMRPEISRLMKPIYPNLKDHDSVKTFDQIMGLSSNIYFIDHKFEEQHDEETRSHSNEYEARYLYRLADYLLKQGYKTDQITILTAYSGQLFQLKKLMPKTRFQGLRITPVDNFQGEENDIILLSLVRSNHKENIGFLKIENRVCVALSRAKKGLFVIGNFEILASQSPLWKEMTIILKQENQLGEKLLLRCQNHPGDAGIEITKPEDFQKAPLGGCQKLCNARLACGHACTMNCHPTDPDHEDYECQKPCTKKCKEGHPCKRRCYQDCGDCKTKIEKTIPNCGHKELVNCHLPASEHKCTHPCTKILDCGHNCGSLCGFPHQCRTDVEKTWLCGHTAKVKCMQRDSVVCAEPCNKQLECGHQCQGKCSECFSGRLHKPCKNKCTKILICDHKCQSDCSNCLPCKMPCQNQCGHSRCKKECGEICTKCEEPCQWRCQHLKCNKKCYEPCDRPPCNQPCRKLLKKCGHPCIGLCGEPCPRLCRICDKDEVTSIFFGTEDEPNARFVELRDCGHVIEYQSLDNWMNQDTSESSTISIQLKSCPRCKTPIRRCVRYGTIINRLLQSIDEVKQKYIGNRTVIERLRSEVYRKALRSSLVGSPLKKIFNKFKESIPNKRTENELIASQNQMEYTCKLQELFVASEKVQENHRPLQPVIDEEYNGLIKDLVIMAAWLSKQREIFSDQEIADSQAELERLSLRLKFINLKLTAEKRKVEMNRDKQHEVKQCTKYFRCGLPLTPGQVHLIKSVLKYLQELVPATGLGISEEERVMVVKAMNLNKGHWYKCRNGHPYAIGDCGGAMEEAKCPTCEEIIGGTHHQLRDGNAVATEMDGAQYAAWSEQANLENYQFDALI